MKHNIYIIIAFILGITVNTAATDYVVISEILYDTPLNENPSQSPYCFGEFIELYNMHTDPANLGGWQLVIPRSGQIYTFPDIALAPQSFLIVAFGEPYTFEDFIDEDMRSEGWTDFHALFSIEPKSTLILHQTQLTLPNDTCTITLKDKAGKARDYVTYGGEIQSFNTMIANNTDYTDIYSLYGNANMIYSVQRMHVTMDLEGCASFHPSNWIGRTRPGERDPNYKSTNSPFRSDMPIRSNIISPPTPDIPIRNYIVSVNPLVEMNAIPEENNSMRLDDLDALIKIDYFDGLGRPLQSVQKAFTPLKKNLVTYTDYDEYGRLAKEWLPIAVDFDYMERTQFTQASQLFYENESRPYREYKYSSDKVSDNVLCDELIGVQAPGEDMNDRYAARKTFPNKAGEVKCFKVNGYTLQASGHYPEKTLLYEQTTDEDGKVSRTYQNKQGQTVMTRQDTNHDTYYVYNDLGQLAYVLPPLAADALGNGTYTETTDAIKKYAYVYQYDERGNCVHKRLPGCEPIYMIYDKADRLVASQDGNQREKNQWTINKYDVLGRLLYNGIIKRNITDAEKKEINDNVQVESYIGGANTGIKGTGFTCGLFSENIEVLTVNYYDNYDFLEIWPVDITNDLVYQEKEGYSKAYAASPILGNATGCKGLLTATATNIIGTNDFIYQIYYYDYRNNIVQTRSTNHMGGYDMVYNDLNFTGQIKKTLKEHNIEGGEVISELYTHTYDHAGRLTKTDYKLNEQAPVTLADMTADGSYDELGRLRKKKRHNGKDSEEYDYNIRNWTTRIKSGDFEQKLYYNTSPSYTPTSSKYYNGNISHTSWTYGKEKTRAYTYYYDKLNRYTSGYTFINEGLLTEYQHTESFQYDKMGNIKRLSRYNIDQQYDLDHLIFTYNGNQVTNISDSWSHNINGLKEYQNKANQSVEFLYDKNGNLVTDLDRDIVTIKYNLLNLPDTVQFKGGNQIINTYDASGKKLQTKHLTLRVPLSTPLVNNQVINLENFAGSIWLSGTRYVDNFQYEMREGQSYIGYDKIYNSEGYVLYFWRTENYFAYFRKDHLGNNREVWLENQIVQRTQYYPSGLPWDESEGMLNLEQPYKYNGKEWIEAHGYDMYDYHARGYYPATSRFTTIDPLAEKYYSISPYAYCMNNPVRYIDPDGMDVDVTYLTDKKQVAALYEAMRTEKGREFVMQFLKKDTGLKFTFGGKDYTFMASKDGKFSNSVLAFYTESLPDVLENGVLSATLGRNEEYNFNVDKNNAPQLEPIESNINYDTRDGMFLKISLNPNTPYNSVDDYINTTLHELFVHTEQDLKTLNSINNDLNKGTLKVGTQDYQLRLNSFNNARGDHNRLGAGNATNYRTAATQIDLIRTLSNQLKRYNEDVKKYK